MLCDAHRVRTCLEGPRSSKHITACAVFHVEAALILVLASALKVNIECVALAYREIQYVELAVLNRSVCKHWARKAVDAHVHDVAGPPIAPRIPQNERPTLLARTLGDATFAPVVCDHGVCVVTVVSLGRWQVSTGLTFWQVDS